MIEIDRHVHDPGLRRSARPAWHLLGGMVSFFAVIFALGASPALAARPYESRLTEANGAAFSDPLGLAVDGSDNLWVGNLGSGGLVDKFSPAGTFEAQSTGTPWTGTNTESVAFSDASNHLYVADSDHDDVWGLNPDATYAGIDLKGPWGTGCCYIKVGADNSAGSTSGDLYVSSSNGTIYRVKSNGDEAPFSASGTKPYIAGNQLTGTSEGAFAGTKEGIVGLAVDSAGELFVASASQNRVDEFAPSGVFLRAFVEAGAGSPFGVVSAVAVDPTNGNVLIADSLKHAVDEFSSTGAFEGQLTEANGAPFGEPQGLAVNSSGTLFVADGSTKAVDIFGPAVPLPTVTYGPVSNPTPTSGTLNAEVDAAGTGEVTGCYFEYGTSTTYGSPHIPCTPPTPYSTPTASVSANISGLTSETMYHYRVVVSNAAGHTKQGLDQTYTPHAVAGLRAEAATAVTGASAQLNGSFVGNGEDTHYFFEWGTTTSYGNRTAVPPGVDAGAPTGPGRTFESYSLTGLAPVTAYHFRLVAENELGQSFSEDEGFVTPASQPLVSESVSEVHSDRAVLNAVINPGGSDTKYHFEYGPSSCSVIPDPCAVAPIPDVDVGYGVSPRVVHFQVSSLTPGTTYRFRIVATNDEGTGSAEDVFVTFPFGFSDACPNAHVRQQTGAALLFDCRAYELVSASNAGGYDVESDLVAGQTPFAGYPDALGPSGEPRILYGVHDGGIPETGNPTNHGVDPYLASRGPDGWRTEYVGIPANDPNATGGPFASTLAEADSSLGTLAFGGPEICSPCFGDGSKGEPIHLPDGELVQGMEGSIAQPGGEPAGFIGKHLSADGTHFVFGSKSQYEPDGNSNGDISIYDRNLTSNVTHVVSKTPGGATLTGPGIGELDVSADGSRILIGQQVSEEGKARYWHLYMNVGDSGQTIDVTPGASGGVIFDGMTADGSKVFFTTKDNLTGDDTDASADIYEAEVSTSAATLTRISTGAAGTGNSDSCDPAANTVHEHWNVTGPEETCGVVAVGGGGGVALGNGTIYFLSPELLDGASNGVLNAPNLYVSKPGTAPHFVATLESNANAPLPKPEHPYLRSFGAFAHPTGVALDPAGDAYVLDLSAEEIGGYVEKFDPAGHLITSFGSSGKVDGESEHSTPFEDSGAVNLPTEIAVDNDPASPSFGDVYVPNLFKEQIYKFSPSGKYEGEIESGFSSGVAVDQATGEVFVTELSGRVYVYSSTGSLLRSFPTISEPTGVAVAPSGIVYVVNGGGGGNATGETVAYDATGTFLRKVDGNRSVGVAVNPADEHVYVDEGNQVSEFDPSGDQVDEPIGHGVITGSVSLSVAEDGALDVSNGGTGRVSVFGPGGFVPPDVETDNPVVVDSVSSPGTRETGDFEVTPSGAFAAFSSALSLTGYNNASHREVFRYDSTGGSLECVSCNPTNAQATGEAALPADGLGLTEDGRVFFNSTDALVDRDLNNQEDPYEWEPNGFDFGSGAAPCAAAHGCVDLVSPGTSLVASSLLGASSSGSDVYFFTRDNLVPQDENGSNVKIYDARELGGFPYVPPAVQCKASDECHGAASPQPPPTVIASTANHSGGAGEKAKCKKTGHKKHRKCAKKHHHRRHHGKRKPAGKKARDKKRHQSPNANG